MAIGPDFEGVSALRLRNRALSRRIRELESGGACAELKARMSSLQREYEAEIKIYNMRLDGKDVFAETCAIFDRPKHAVIDVAALPAAG